MSRLTKAQAQQAEQAKAIDKLREILKPGDTVHCILRHVSRSGMSRQIDVYKMCEDGPLYLSWHVATALDMKRSDNGAIKIGGCGMDMGFALVYELSRALFQDRFTCIGKDCPSNDHCNGDRVYESHPHSDGGYALRHRWL